MNIYNLSLYLVFVILKKYIFTTPSAIDLELIDKLKAKKQFLSLICP